MYYISYLMFFVVNVWFPCLVFVPGLLFFLFPLEPWFPWFTLKGRENRVQVLCQWVVPTGLYGPVVLGPGREGQWALCTSGGAQYGLWCLTNGEEVRADNTLRVQGSILKKQPKSGVHVDNKVGQVSPENPRTQPMEEPQILAQFEQTHWGKSPP